MFDIFIAFLLGVAVAGIIIFGYQTSLILGKPTLLARLKAWWPGFVKRHIGDVDPEPFDPQSPTRYVPEQYVDWAQLEQWAIYVAKDKGGMVCQFEMNPTIVVGHSYWWEEDGKVLSVPSSAIIAPFPPWQESKRRRPE